MYLAMACLEEPLRSLSVEMAVTIISSYLGWAGGALGFFCVEVPFGGILTNGWTVVELGHNRLA